MIKEMAWLRNYAFLLQSIYNSKKNHNNLVLVFYIEKLSNQS